MPGVPVSLVRCLLIVLGSCALLVSVIGCSEQGGKPSVQTREPVRLLVVELHGYIGCGVDTDLIAQPIAEEIARVHEPIDAVVFSIDSGGGMLNRVGPLSDLIHERVGPRWRTLAWIERAESAAALVALSVPELWMPSDALIGGAVGVQGDEASGRWVALPGQTQEAIRYVAAASAARGGHDRELALSMTIGDGDAAEGRVLTGDRAAELGLARNAASLEAALDRVFGEGGWRIEAEPSQAISSRIAEAERLRENAIELQTRFGLAMQRAEAGDPYAVSVADGYFEELLDLTVREDEPARRVIAFLGLFDWVDSALNRMEAIPGEGGE